MVNQFGLPKKTPKESKKILLYSFFYKGVFKDTAGHDN